MKYDFPFLNIVRGYARLPKKNFRSLISLARLTGIGLFSLVLIFSFRISASAFILTSSATVGGSANGDDRGKNIALDSAGNIYAVGFTSQTDSGYDIWVGKYGPNFSLISSTTINGTGNTHDRNDSIDSADIAIDDNDNVYVVGTTSETSTGFDIWIGKFNSGLNIQSSITIDGPGNATDEKDSMIGGDSGTSIAVDDGFVYVSGVITDASGDLKGWMGKYDSSLVLQSSATIDGAVNLDIAINGGDLYGAGTIVPPLMDIWISKFDRDNLNLISSVTIQGQPGGENIANGIAIYDSNVYVIGSSSQLVSGTDIYIGKFDSDFNVLAPPVVSNLNNEDEGLDITIDSSGNVYAIGEIQTQTGPDEWVSWFAKYDSSLVLQSSTTGNVFNNGIAIDSLGAIYGAGDTWVSGERDNILITKYNLPTESPTLTGAVLGISSIEWNWNDDQYYEEGFRVVNSTGGSESGSLSANITSWTEENLLPSTLYNRRVVAFNAGYTSTSTAVDKYTNPAEPLFIGFSDVTSSSFTVLWNANENGEGTMYRTAVSTSTEFPNTFTGSRSINTTSETADFSGLEVNTTYYFFAMAENLDGVQTDHILLGSTATLANMPVSADPTLIAIGTTSATVSWNRNDNPENVTVYTVVLSTGVSYPNSFSGNVSVSTIPIGSVPTATLNGLNANTLYYLYIKAVNHNGISSEFTAPGSGVTLANQPDSVSPTFQSVHITSTTLFFDTNNDNPLADPLNGTDYVITFTTSSSYNDTNVGNVTKDTVETTGQPSVDIIGYNGLENSDHF